MLNGGLVVTPTLGADLSIAPCYLGQVSDLTLICPTRHTLKFSIAVPTDKTYFLAFLRRITIYVPVPAAAAATTAPAIFKKRRPSSPFMWSGINSYVTFFPFRK